MNNPYRNTIHTFEDAANAAKRVSIKYQQFRADPTTRPWAIYRILGDVYLLTIAMQHEGKIDRIHTSCLSRLPNTEMQKRSAFAIVVLLLGLINPEDCKRYRVSKALAAAQKAGIGISGLCDRSKRMGA